MTASYDFRTLSPLDFEELVRDLLQAEWGIRLESFGPGPDRGIDIRYLGGTAATVIQAKHFLGSGYSALLRAVGAERGKALALAPKRYVLATSVSLSVDRKAALIDAMAGVPLAAGDIFGLEDLNNLLRAHPAIERQHFKLWLSSSAVLERILNSGLYNRTDAEMDIIREMVPRFVQNRSVAEAERLLDANGTLIIAGQPGVGKTTLARMLLWLHAEQGWKVFVVDSLDEAFTVADPSERRLILLDDFLGQVRLSADQLRGIDARLPPLLSRVAAHENLRFVLTTRDYILAQARDIAARLAPGQISARDYVLDVGHYTREVRARILYNHICFSDLGPEQREALLRDDFYLQIIDHKNFNPRLIQEVTSGRYLELTDGPLRDTIKEVLDNPVMLWERPYRQHIGEEGRIMMLALFINGGAAGVEALRASYVRVARAFGTGLRAIEVEPSFRSTYRLLDGSVLALSQQRVQFANPGLSDFLQATMISDRLIPPILAEIETPRELEELWSLFVASGPDEDERGRLAGDWTAAFDRVEAGGGADHFQLLRMATDLAGLLDHAPLRDRFEQCVATFEAADMARDEVSEACSLLELSFTSGLPWALEERLRTAVTRAAAALLTGWADELSVEDIQSLDEALHLYGNDDELAMRASHAAMESLTHWVESEADSIRWVEDLDEYEANMVAFMSRRSFPTARVEADIRYRRERLAEQGAFERPAGYLSSSRRDPRADLSDHELRSMFGGLGGP